MSPLQQVVLVVLVLDVALATSGWRPLLCTKGRSQPATASGSAPVNESIVRRPVSGHASKESVTSHFSPAEPIPVSGSLPPSSSATFSHAPSEPVHLQRGSHTIKDVMDVLASLRAYDAKSGSPSNPLPHEPMPTRARSDVQQLRALLSRAHGIRERGQGACPARRARHESQLGYKKLLNAEIEHFERHNDQPHNFLSPQTFADLDSYYILATATDDWSAESRIEIRLKAILKIRELLVDAEALPANWNKLDVVRFALEHRRVLQSTDELSPCQWRLCGITEQGDAILQNASGQGVIVDSDQVHWYVVDNTPPKPPSPPPVRVESSNSAKKSSSSSDTDSDTDYGSIAASVAAVL